MTMDIREADLLARTQADMIDDCLISDDISAAWAANLAELAAIKAARTNTTVATPTPTVVTTTAPSMITTFLVGVLGMILFMGGLSVVANVVVHVMHYDTTTSN